MILLPDTPTTALSPAGLRRWILLFVITVGFMARMATFQVPLLDHHSWRQADGATIARNFYREGLSPLRPAIDGRGVGVPNVFGGRGVAAGSRRGGGRGARSCSEQRGQQHGGSPGLACKHAW